MKVWFENKEESAVVNTNESLYDNSNSNNTLNAFCCYPFSKKYWRIRHQQ